MEIKQWFTILKNQLRNSPLVSNAVFSFILMGLEKLVDLEFECPCKPNGMLCFHPPSSSSQLSWVLLSWS
uniref:Uncharacterized protein n=1 Tax=Anguilla anguilla TaxID=7936 RepID=A0A0E9W9H8_ANGAN